MAGEIEKFPKSHFFADSQNAIIVLQKTDISDEESQKILASHLSCKEIFNNDIYSQFLAEVHQTDLNPLKITLIYPASDADIEKYSASTPHVIRETPQRYKQVTLPNFIEKELESKLEWVYNILDHKKEVESILFENEDFVLVKNFKWEEKSIDTLYYLAFPKKRGIRTIRDLKGEDVKMLESIRDEGVKAIKERFGLGSDQVRAFFHYYPSFLYLHVHIMNVKWTPTGSTFIGKAIFLDDVIDWLKMDGDYFEKCSLTCVLSENHPAYLELD